MVRGVCISAFLALLSFFTKGRCQDLLNSYFFRVVSGTKFFRLLQQQERVSGSLVDLVHLNYSKPLWVSRATSNLTPGVCSRRHKAQGLPALLPGPLCAPTCSHVHHRGPPAGKRARFHCICNVCCHHRLSVALLIETGILSVFVRWFL